MLHIALAFLAGILLVQLQSTLPALGWVALIFPVPFLIRRFPAAQSILLLAAVFVAGIFWSSFRAGLILGDELKFGLEGQDIWLVGHVVSIPRLMYKGSRFEFRVDSASLNGEPIKVPRRVLLSVYQQLAAPGVDEKWRLKVRLKRPNGFQNPGGFDYEAYLFQKRIRAKGYVREAQRLKAAKKSWSFNRTRIDIATNFQKLLPDSPHQGILIALATGNRNLLTPQQWNQLRDTGTSHLVAISGLHIGIITGLAFFIFRWLWSLPGTTTLYLPAPRFAALGAMVVAFLYAGLAGFSLPTQRALIMLVVVFGGLFFHRRFHPPAVLGGALLAVLLFDPLAVLGAGFWLSFVAVGLILMVVQCKYPDDNKLLKLVRIQWALAVGLVPLTLYFFQQSSLVAPLANLVAVPVFSIVVVPTTLAAAVATILLPDSIAFGILSLADMTLDIIWTGLGWLDDTVPVFANAISLSVALSAAIGAILLLSPRGLPARWLGLAGFLPILFVSMDAPVPGEYRLTLLDVGQGLAVVVQTSRHLLVYDTGPRFSKSFDTGRAVVLPYLRHIGRHYVDTLIISHGDNDHAGGARSLLAEMRVNRILSSVPARFPRGQQCYEGQQWQWDGVGFEILSPQLEDPFDKNNNSCVLRISTRFGSVLIPGDIEREREAWLIQKNGPDLKSDFLIAPHHGSRTSSTNGFVDLVNPGMVLFPVGYRNRYRHPNRNVIDRYVVSGSQILLSPETGAIEISISRDGWKVEKYRHQKRRYWFN
ncbi:MAG: DNA internalization-related competence protein ComEC/Rec2 [Acidiferrobacterales bacterium]